jgi:DNA polymerase elongation subunit (family B)
MKAPRIVAIDIETSQHIVGVFDLHDPGFISPDQIIEPSRILMASAHVLGERSARVYTEHRGHKAMLRGIRREMEQADLILTYNGNRFDLPRLAGEFETHGIPQPKPFASIDLYQTVRGLKLASGKLGYVAPVLGVGEKIKHDGLPLWRAVAAKDPSAVRKMAEYCARDSSVLLPMYLRLRHRIKNHPVLSDTGCPSCGSDKLQSRGHRLTKTARIERLECQNCGSWPDGTRSRIQKRKAA